MKFNACKTRTMIVYRSRTMHPQSPSIIYLAELYRRSLDDLVILEVTFYSKILFHFYIQRGRIAKVVVSHAEGCKVARSNRAVAELHRFIICTRRSGGNAHEGWGCDQSIGFSVSDSIVRSWLWSTATNSSHCATSAITGSS